MTQNTKNNPFSAVRFLSSAPNPNCFPEPRDRRGKPLPEVAFVGRSNVGKSSLLNDLLGNKIARVSKTPGKTQALQFFVVEDLVCFVDLPGYGYAQVSKQMQKEWEVLIQSYLQHRPHLKLIFLLLDIRREPSEDDLLFIQWANHYKKPLVIVLTKVDKVSKNEKVQLIKVICNTLSCTPSDLLFHSCKTHEGQLELRKRLLSFLKSSTTGI